MKRAIVQSQTGITLVGAGPAAPAALARALALAPRLVAADGGAGRALAAGLVPEAVIGDLDSLQPAARARLPEAALHRVAEQETTDFDKALRHIDAPFILAVGFTGARLDHALGVMNALTRHPEKRCLLLSSHDICFLAPRRLTLELPRRSRLSLFPMAPVTGTSQGLRWPIDGLDFAPGGRIGTSNEVTEPQVHLSFSSTAMLVVLARAALPRALTALVPGLRLPAGQRPARGE
jgi:thiamine pyrophosphokinase